MSVEAYIRDVTDHSYQICGKLFSGDFTQIVKQNNDGTDVTAEHAFYTIDDDKVVKKLGSVSYTEDATGTISMGFGVFNSTTGTTESILDIGGDGLTVQGGISVIGGSTVFETTSISVADFDIELGSGALLLSELDGGGLILGTVDSGQKSILYSLAMDAWTANAGFNVETGHAFTVNDDTVILDESGLTISDILLSSTGLNIGTEVELSSTALTIGSTDPVILNSSGLVVGTNLSLDTTNGLIAGDITLNSTDGLVIGTDIELNVADGLTLGTINLTTLGLFLGSDLELSLANGLVLPDMTMTNTAITYNDLTTGGDIVVNEQGIYIGDDISLTKTGGLNLGSGASIDLESISFGIAPDQTVLDDTSLVLGTDITLNHDGLYMPNTDAAIYMGDTNQWKISFDSTSENLKFEYYDSTSAEYVVKMELKSSN